MKITICSKCKNFTPHYSHSKKFGFSKINCGHCRKKLIKKKDCGCFEQSNENFEEEISILDRLYNFDIQLERLSFNFETLINSVNTLKTEILNLLNKN